MALRVREEVQHAADADARRERRPERRRRRHRVGVQRDHERPAVPINSSIDCASSCDGAAVVSAVCVDQQRPGRTYK